MPEIIPDTTLVHLNNGLATMCPLVLLHLRKGWPIRGSIADSNTIDVTRR
jgi:hypothetical protein